jgi:hypothetical protein
MKSKPCAWLDIAVHDAGCVRCGERFARLHDVLDRDLDGHRALLMEHFA